MATPREWVAGARPRTLTAAIAPVFVGTAIAVSLQALDALRALLALGVAVALQIGVNYANDYSDGIKGTDAVRVGPVRLVGQQRASAGAVRSAAVGAFLIAAVLGFVLVALVGQWWLLLVGAASIAAGWLYTGGPRPYGYAGLGEVFVLIFFGVVPVAGTAYVQTLTFTPAMFIAGVAIGLPITAILIANNLRDIPTDLAAGKRTLATRLGDARTRTLFAFTIVLAYMLVIVLAFVVSPWLLLTLASVPLAIRPVRTVRAGAQGRALIAVLQQTSLLVLVFGLLLGLGFILIEVLGNL